MPTEDETDYRDTAAETFGTAERPVADRLKIRYVLAVWGATYIDRYFGVAFPTHLAPGNLPAVAQRADLSFAVLTRTEDIERFKSQRMFHRLLALGTVEFIGIDDLISHPGVFTVTLTLAFTRALRVAGDQATETNFLFMNADFLLADGTLAAVLDRLKTGAKAVLTATPRAVAEQLMDTIANRSRAADGALVLKPREMVAYALSAPHLMVTAKQPDLPVLHTTVPNQFFWRVDDTTLLARSFIVFMLALRPARNGYQATNYCDYTMVADLIGDGRAAVLADSDDGFILELQSARQEAEMIRLGRLEDGDVVRHLAAWTTPHHREMAKHDFIFHSQELPATLLPAQRRAADYMDRIDRQLPPPVDGHNHPYWIGGLSAWQHHRPTQSLPPEAARIAARPALETEAAQRIPEKTHATASHTALQAVLARVFRSVYARAEPFRRRLRMPTVVSDLEPLVELLVARARDGATDIYGDVPDVIVRALPSTTVVRRDVAEVGRASAPGDQTVSSLVAIVDVSNFHLLPSAFARAHQRAEAGGVAVLLVAGDGLEAGDVRYAIAKAVQLTELRYFSHLQDIHDQAPQARAAEASLRAVVADMHRGVTLPNMAAATRYLAVVAAHQMAQWSSLELGKLGRRSWFNGFSLVFEQRASMAGRDARTIITRPGPI